MYKIVNKTKTSADLLIYEDIGDGFFGGVSAKQIADDLKGLKDTKQLNVRINSPGGSVFEGVTIYNILKQHSANVTTYVDGLAASIASIIAMAGDKVIMADNALMMIHDPWSMTVGSAADLRKEADVLDTVKDVLVETYARKSSQSADVIREWMAEETWFTAADAIEFGLADEQEEPMLAAAKFDISRYTDRYKKVPKNLLELVTPAQKNKARVARINAMKAITERTVPRAVRERHNRAKMKSA